MKYAYAIETDGAMTVHSFTDETIRAQWIDAQPSTRGALSGNSKVVKGALYRESVISGNAREKETTNLFIEIKS